MLDEVVIVIVRKISIAWPVSLPMICGLLNLNARLGQVESICAHDGRSDLAEAETGVTISRRHS